MLHAGVRPASLDLERRGALAGEADRVDDIGARRDVNLALQAESRRPDVVFDVEGRVDREAGARSVDGSRIREEGVELRNVSAPSLLAKRRLPLLTLGLSPTKRSAKASKSLLRFSSSSFAFSKPTSSVQSCPPYSFTISSILLSRESSSHRPSVMHDCMCEWSMLPYRSDGVEPPTVRMISCRTALRVQ